VSQGIYYDKAPESTFQNVCRQHAQAEVHVQHQPQVTLPHLLRVAAGRKEGGRGRGGWRHGGPEGRQNGASHGALNRVPTQLPAPPYSPLRTQVGQQPIVRCHLQVFAGRSQGNELCLLLRHFSEYKKQCTRKPSHKREVSGCVPAALCAPRGRCAYRRAYKRSRGRSPGFLGRVRRWFARASSASSAYPHQRRTCWMGSTRDVSVLAYVRTTYTRCENITADPGKSRSCSS
jgi:hypothetical protein